MTDATQGDEIETLRRDAATDLATRITALEWKARKDWTVDEQADRHGELQEMIDSELASLRERLAKAEGETR